MRALRFAAPILLGILIGATLITVHMGRQIEQLMYTVRVLNEELTAANRELESARDSLSDQRLQVVRGIKVDVRLPDELTSYEERSVRLEIEKTVKGWLQPLHGQDVKALRFPVVPQIIDGRDVDVDGKVYRLQTRIVYIGEEIIVYVEGKPERSSVPIT
ncbi:MAG: hypothetical protein U1D96_06360 [Eubacteriales bacterium]|jgi:hypothetical protein|nr:hypothetical protein [Bacillota bacterium]MBV1726887.1 hypothetical protein [Desulforudis sp.]MDP3050816.1 hypothetical protein [Eubacteriales bacterium]MBV1736060.1 hypothetical protein [Desulforudis sp.]MDZ4043099.1 hypothetical protein [Eubacteriales bacterium]